MRYGVFFLFHNLSSHWVRVVMQGGVVFFSCAQQCNSTMIFSRLVWRPSTVLKLEECNVFCNAFFVILIVIRQIRQSCVRLIISCTFACTISLAYYDNYNIYCFITWHVIVFMPLTNPRSCRAVQHLPYCPLSGLIVRDITRRLTFELDHVNVQCKMNLFHYLALGNTVLNTPSHGCAVPVCMGRYCPKLQSIM